MCVCVCRVENRPLESAVSFHHVGSEDEIQVIMVEDRFSQVILLAQ